MSWPAVNPGRLRHRITIKRPVVGSGVSGSKVTWQDFVTTYADIQPGKPGEAVRSGQITSVLYVVITMNWQSGIQAKMQVQGPSGLYVIEDVVNVGELNVTLNLMCLALGSSNQ